MSRAPAPLRLAPALARLAFRRLSTALRQKRRRVWNSDGAAVVCALHSTMRQRRTPCLAALMRVTCAPRRTHTQAAGVVKVPAVVKQGGLQLPARWRRMRSGTARRPGGRGVLTLQFRHSFQTLCRVLGAGSGPCAGPWLVPAPRPPPPAPAASRPSRLGAGHGCGSSDLEPRRSDLNAARQRGAMIWTHRSD